MGMSAGQAPKPAQPISSNSGGGGSASPLGLLVPATAHDAGRQLVAQEGKRVRRALALVQGAVQQLHRLRVPLAWERHWGGWGEGSG